MNNRILLDLADASPCRLTSDGISKLWS